MVREKILLTIFKGTYYLLEVIKVIANILGVVIGILMFHKLNVYFDIVTWISLITLTLGATLGYLVGSLINIILYILYFIIFKYYSKKYLGPATTLELLKKYFTKYE